MYLRITNLDYNRNPNLGSGTKFEWQVNYFFMNLHHKRNTSFAGLDYKIQPSNIKQEVTKCLSTRNTCQKVNGGHWTL